MGHKIEVTVVRKEEAFVEVSKRQIVNLAQAEIVKVLNAFAETVRQEYLRELAANKDQKYSENTNSEFSIKVDGKTTALYEVDGYYDYHNDYYRDGWITNLSEEESAGLVEFDKRLADAVHLLGGNYEGL